MLFICRANTILIKTIVTDTWLSLIDPSHIIFLPLLSGIEKGMQDLRPSYCHCLRPQPYLIEYLLFVEIPPFRLIGYSIRDLLSAVSQRLSLQWLRWHWLRLRREVSSESLRLRQKDSDSHRDKETRQRHTESQSLQPRIEAPNPNKWRDYSFQSAYG